MNLIIFRCDDCNKDRKESIRSKWKCIDEFSSFAKCAACGKLFRITFAQMILQAVLLFFVALPYLWIIRRYSFVVDMVTWFASYYFFRISRKIPQATMKWKEIAEENATKGKYYLLMWGSIAINFCSILLAALVIEAIY